MIIKRSYNTEIANAIHQHLKFFEFPYHFVEHAGTFMFPMGFGGTATALIYHINVLFHNWSPDEAIKLCEISEESASSRKNANAEEVKEAFSLRSFLHRRRSAHEPYAEEAEYTLVENDT